MGLKSNLALLILVGGLGAYLYSKRDEPVTPGPPPKKLGTPLFGPGEFMARAAQIRLLPGKDLQPILLERDKLKNLPRFFLKDPVEDLAASSYLEAMFKIYQGALLQQGYTDAELEAHPNLRAETGLDEPLAEIEIRWEGDKTRRIEFGKPGLDVSEVFVRVDGGPVMLASRALLNPVRVNPDDIREHVLFTTGDIGLHPTRVRLQVDLPEMKRVDELTRTPSGVYRITEPGRFRADPKGVDGFLASLSALRVDRFMSGALSPSFQELLEQPQVRLEVEGRRGKEVLVASQLGGGTGWLGHLQQRKITFQISNERSMVGLLQWVPNLRARHLLPFPLDKMRRLEFDRRNDTTPLVLLRRHDGFDLELPVKVDSNPTPIQEILSGLQDLQALRFLDEPPADAGLGDEDPYLSLRIHTQTGAEQLRIRIGRRVGEQIHLRREDETTVVLVAFKAVAPLLRPWQELVSRKVLEEKIRPERLEVEVPGKPEALVYLFAEGAWTAAGQSEEDDAVASLVEDLQLLRARGEGAVQEHKVVEDRAARRIVLRFMRKVDNRDVLLSLELWPEGDKHVLLRSSNQPSHKLVYRIKRPLYRQLYERWSR